MTAPTRKRTDPLMTVLFDLETLHADIQFLLPVGWVKTFDGFVNGFIDAIHKVQASLRERP